MAVLKIYNKEKELILVSQEFTGDKGSGLLTDLMPNTTYEEGTYFVSWEDKNYETELIPVPKFTTESNTNKELVFYFKDALTVKPMTAYDIAVKNGFSGTEKEWVESIKGEPGDSAYEISVKYGFSGTEEEWIESMKTANGDLVPKNLVTNIVSNTTLSSTTGSENPSDNYSSVDFIEVKPSKVYTYGYSNLDNVTKATTRVVLYDDSKTMISIWDWKNIYEDKNINITIPPEASYIRFIIPNNLTDYFYFNEGEIPYFVIEKQLEEEKEEENKKIVNKVIENLDLNKLKEEKKPLKPYPNKLMWKALEENTNIKPLTMNREGTVIYASDGLRITQSTDEGKTWTYIGGTISEQMVQGIRVLDDGELIVTTSRDKNNGIKSKLYKSSNYSVENPENTTYTEKLEMNNLDAMFNNPWCLDNYYNIVLASDYGGHYLTGARYVYLSTDYGETWETIFDQKEVSETVDGAPTYTTDAHVHTCHYDRYRERIWVCVGDQDNTAVYYSDDMGKTWEIIKGYTGKDAMQYTGITSYPEGVFFGSDRAPDGVYFWDEDKPDEINPYYLTERSDIRTIVYALPFRRFAEKDEVCYFVGNRDGVVDGTMSPVIVGFKGVHGAQLLYDFTDDIDEFNYTDISACVGNTANNNVLVSVKDDSTKRYRLLIAKAPVWE